MFLGGCATLSGDTQPVTTQVDLSKEIKRVYLPPFDYPAGFTCVSRSGMIPVGAAYIPTHNTACFTGKDAQALRQSLVSSLQTDQGVAVIERLPAADADARPGSAILEVAFTKLGLAKTWDGSACEMAGVATVRHEGESQRKDFSIRERSLFATVNGAKKAAYTTFSKQMASLMSDDRLTKNN